MSAVSLRGVQKSYGKVVAVHGIDLEIQSGEFIVFVGPSGCGKSTLMRMIAGLEEITAGEIAIGGRVVNDLDPRDRDIAMVFQDYALYPNKTVYENMAFGLRLRKATPAEIDRLVADAAQTLQITHLLERLPKELSGGQRQRVAMGRAMVRDPAVFLFDEPLSNLDALLRHQVRAEIKRLHQRVQSTVIYVTHDQVEAMTLADRIVVLKDGRIVQVGTPDEIYHRPQHRFVAEFMGSPPMNLIDATVVPGSDGLALLLPGPHRVALEGALGAVLRERAGHPVVLGIRPESVQLRSRTTPEDWPGLNLAVNLVEPLGAENVVHFALGDRDIIARMPNAHRPMLGSSVDLSLDPECLRLFDAETGAALQ